MNSTDKEKYELKEQLRILRGELSGDLESIGGRLNVVQRFQNSFLKDRNKWLIGGLVVGTVVAFTTSKRSFERKEPRMGDGLMKNLFLGLLGMTTKQILKESGPSIAKYLQKELGGVVAARANTTQAADKTLNDQIDQHESNN